jgi:predicted phage terminase large subunit-like protein
MDPLRGVERWRLTDDQNAKTLFANTKTGSRLALGVGGQGTGYRGNAVIVDDAMNASDAPSPVVRESTIAWWDVQMSSRVNDLSKDSFVIMGQRLHENDLTGHALEQGGYEYLCLPSEFDPARRATTSLGVIDKRTEAGELLFPQLFPKAVLDEAKKRLGSDGYSGQHDQNPVPPGGSLLKKSWWKFWRWDTDQPTTTERPRGCNAYPTRVVQAKMWKWDSVVMSVDATFKSLEASKGRDPDYVVIMVIACKGPDRFVLYRYRKQIGFNETCEQIKEAAKLFPLAFRKLVEDKANGSAIIETLKSVLQGVIPVDPEGGKEARANAVAPQIEAGNVYLPEGAPWLDEFITECAFFPKGRHDDQVDALTQALIDRMHGKGDRLRMLVGG